MKIKLVTICVSLLVSLSGFQGVAQASLRVEDFTSQLENLQLSAEAALAWNVDTGQILFSKGGSVPRVPASLTKLVTAMVVLDSNVPLKKKCKLVPENEVGGARLPAKIDTQYLLRDALTVSLVASLNNTTNMMAGCIGLNQAQFVERMNKKAHQLGAVHTLFYEPTGMDIRNVVTAEDMVKIADTAFKNPVIQRISQKQTFSFCSLGVKRYCFNLRNTNALLADKGFKVMGGKTGFLEESMFNFVSILKDKSGTKIGVVVLGSDTKANSFAEAKRLIEYASQKRLWNEFSPKILAVNN